MRFSFVMVYINLRQNWQCLRGYLPGPQFWLVCVFGHLSTKNLTCLIWYFSIKYLRLGCDCERTEKESTSIECLKKTWKDAHHFWRVKNCHYYVQKFGVSNFFYIWGKSLTKGCIYLIQLNLIQIITVIIRIYCNKYYYNLKYYTHDPSEINLICWSDAQETFLNVINVDNSFCCVTV